MCYVWTVFKFYKDARLNSLLYGLTVNDGEQSCTVDNFKRYYNKINNRTKKGEKENTLILEQEMTED